MPTACRLARRIFAVTLIAVTAFAISIAACIASHAASLPRPTRIDHLLPSPGAPDAVWVRSATVPHLVNAFVASHDRRFLSHRRSAADGVASIAWLAWRSSLGGRIRICAETLPYAAARTVVTSDDPGAHRALRTMILAAMLEAARPKDAILDVCSNRAYFGRGAYGIDAASRIYFAHPATELALPEIAVLVGASVSPRHSLRSDQALRARAEYVLTRMAADHMIDAAELAAAKAQLDRTVATARRGLPT